MNIIAKVKWLKNHDRDSRIRLTVFPTAGYLSIYAAYGCPILGNSADMYL